MVVTATFALLGVGLSGLAVASSSAATTSVAPMVPAAVFGTTHHPSFYWSGYVITTTGGGVTDVQGSWHAPGVAAACPSSARNAGFFVGIDGATSSTTLEEIGTATNCQSGSPQYYAWYEVAPVRAGTFSLSIKAGDAIHAEIQFSKASKLFTLSLKDTTSGKHVTQYVADPGALRVSAEWITEISSTSTRLTDFGSVTFTNASATIHGHSHSISGFSNQALTMLKASTTTKMAVPSALSNGGKTFKVTWKSAGP